MTIQLRDNRFGVKGLFFKKQERDGSVVYVPTNNASALLGRRGELSTDDASVLEKFGGETLSRLVSHGAVVDVSGSHLGRNDRVSRPEERCVHTS